MIILFQKNEAEGEKNPLRKKGVVHLSLLYDLIDYHFVDTIFSIGFCFEICNITET